MRNKELLLSDDEIRERMKQFHITTKILEAETGLYSTTITRALNNLERASLFTRYLLDYHIRILSGEVVDLKVDESSSINEFLRLRCILGYSSDHVAHFLGVSTSRYSRFEQGQYDLPPQKLVNLCKMLNEEIGDSTPDYKICYPNHYGQWGKRGKIVISYLPRKQENESSNN